MVPTSLFTSPFGLQYKVYNIAARWKHLGVTVACQFSFIAGNCLVCIGLLVGFFFSGTSRGNL